MATIKFGTVKGAESFSTATNSITFANGFENTSETSNAEWVQYGKTFYSRR